MLLLHFIQLLLKFLLICGMELLFNYFSLIFNSIEFLFNYFFLSKDPSELISFYLDIIFIIILRLSLSIYKEISFLLELFNFFLQMVGSFFTSL